MKVAILAGGVGNRLGGDTEAGPKPMVEIGGRPLLWHIMSHYSAFGHDEFVVAVGLGGDVIKRYFADFGLAHHDVRIETRTGQVTQHRDSHDTDWIVDVVDTGLLTETGGRVTRLAHHLDGTFMLTFGDAVADVDLHALHEFHLSHGKLATLTAVHPPPRFGELKLDGEEVVEFSEKPMDAGWINGGFMMLEPGIFEYLDEDDVPLTPEPMQHLAKDGELAAFRHESFWHAVDSMRDKVLLEDLWRSPGPPWLPSRKTTSA